MRDDLVSWANAKYREFAVKMLDVLPDFPNCCYQVSGAAAIVRRADAVCQRKTDTTSMGTTIVGIV